MTRDEFLKQTKEKMNGEPILSEVVAVKAGTIAVVDEWQCDRKDDIRNEQMGLMKEKTTFKLMGGWDGYYNWNTQKVIDMAFDEADRLGYDIVAIDSFEDGKLWVQVDAKTADSNKEFFLWEVKNAMATYGSLNKDATALEFDENDIDHLAEEIYSLAKELADRKLNNVMAFAMGYFGSSGSYFIQALTQHIKEL